jgi:hypothetical protein
MQGATPRWHHLWFRCLSLFWRWCGNSRPLTPTAYATEAAKVPAAERVVIAERTTAGSPLVPAAVLRATIRSIDIAGVGAVANAELWKRVITLRVGDAGLAWREAVSRLVQPGIDRARRARTRVRIGAHPGAATQAAAAATVPATAAPLVCTAAIVVGLDDVVTRDRGVGC